MTSGIPKQRLVKAIIDTFSESRIRSGFNLLPTTNVIERLSDMRKDSLEEFLKSSAKGTALFKDLVERFPKNMPRTFFPCQIASVTLHENIQRNLRALCQSWLKKKEKMLFL